jgi:ribosomal protein L24
MIYKSSKYLKEDFDFNKVKKQHIEDEYEITPSNIRILNSKLNKSIFDIISSFKNKKCNKLKKLFKCVGSYPKLGNVWSYHKGIINIVE